MHNSKCCGRLRYLHFHCVVVLAMHINEFGGRGYCRSTDRGGAFVLLLSSNIKSLFPEFVNQPLIPNTFWHLCTNSSSHTHKHKHMLVMCLQLMPTHISYPEYVTSVCYIFIQICLLYIQDIENYLEEDIHTDTQALMHTCTQWHTHAHVHTHSHAGSPVGARKPDTERSGQVILL